MRRKMEQWINMRPETVCGGSQAQVLFCVKDAQADIIELAARVRELEVKIKSAAPYPFCRTPDKCAGAGYCRNDPACNN